MQFSRWLATAVFVGSVPGSIGLAYLGYVRGFYAYETIPLAFGAIFVLVLAVLVTLLTGVRRLEA